MTNQEVASLFEVVWDGSLVAVASSTPPTPVSRHHETAPTTVEDLLRASTHMLSRDEILSATGLGRGHITNQLYRLHLRGRLWSRYIAGTSRKEYWLARRTSAEAWPQEHIQC